MRETLTFVLCILLMVSRADWIDPDTPLSLYTTEPLTPRVKPYRPNVVEDEMKNATNSTTDPPSMAPSSSPTMFPTMSPKRFELIFSDEFNAPGRSFADGTDPRWTALNKNDYTNDALHYYSPNNVITNEDGELVITSEAADTDVVGYDDVRRKNTHIVKHFKSAMLQTWNKFCFTGGIIEAEVVMPGDANVGGLWPAFWLLGNLARHTYVGSSEHIWPWSASNCTAKSRWAQLINGCSHVVHYGFEEGLGRGAPEIDIFEVQPGNIKKNHGPFLESSVGQPFMSASYQVAPGRPFNRPWTGHWPGPGQWYEGLKGGRETNLNINFYGTYNHFRDDVNPIKQDYWSDAISFNRQLNEAHFNSSHVYRLEWEPPTAEHDGYLHWFLDGELVLAINGTGIRDSGIGSEVSSEPMYILLNTAISKQWGFPLTCPNSCECEEYNCHSSEWSDTCGFSPGFCQMMLNKTTGSPKYRINWVRAYQDPNNDVHKVGCSTPERPTRRFIEAHEDLYKLKDDLHPLRGIQRGRGVCQYGVKGTSRLSCGGFRRGRCTKGRVCECNEGWTGPHCLAPEGSDPILYDVPDKIVDVGFVAPGVAPYTLMGGLCALLVFLMCTVRCRRRMDGWSPIPNAVLKPIT